MTHPHAEVLRAIADGVPLSEFEIWHETWGSLCFESLSNYLLWVQEPDRWTIRRKQRTHVVNGFTVPAPMDKEPSTDATYFMSNLYAEDYCVQNSWANFQSEHLWLKRGLCFATKEAAIANAKAMLKIDPEAA